MQTLKIGDRGTYVEYLSLALRRAGFSPGKIKNTFDEDVHNALVAFQNSVGISADGIAGEITYSYLIPYLKGYTIITAEANDTPDSLAKKYSTTCRAQNW